MGADATDPTAAGDPATADRSPHIGILVVAYNAASTLAAVLERIPSSLAGSAEVLVSDDHSGDNTFDVAVAQSTTQGSLPTTTVRQSSNLGYGGNQKFGYRWAIDRGLEVVVLLHGDGQYAPELLPDLVAPILAGEADVVMGSRMLDQGQARAGGMPLYKFVGNRILTRYQNAMAGMDLSEWHSGYRAFSVKALAQIPFERNSDGFDFDTEVLLQLDASGARILEVPIPTYYGDEICYVNGMAYARDVVADVTRARLARMGFGTPAEGTTEDHYEWKPDPDSSHGKLIDVLSTRTPGRLLDVGCGEGQLSELARDLGHTVTAIDLTTPRTGRIDGVEFIEADLDDGLPTLLQDRETFDTVVAADVLEHVRSPQRLMEDIRNVMEPHGQLVVSVPNFAHWYPRLRVATGMFDYDRRGILDAGHVRFFTRRSFLRLAGRAGWKCEQVVPVGLPFDVADRGGGGGLGSFLRSTVGRVDRLLCRWWPKMFAYQFVFVFSRWGPDDPAATYTTARQPQSAGTPILD